MPVEILRARWESGKGPSQCDLAEIPKSLRSHDFSDRYKPLFSLSEDPSTRDRDGINRTFSGLMKIIFRKRAINDVHLHAA